MRFFNTAGPVDAAKHYVLPPLSRFDLDEVMLLIAQEKYFLLHAPRQTGKTSCLQALAAHLNAGGRYAAVYANIETAQAMREDVDRAMALLVTELGRWARLALGTPETEVLAREVLADTPHAGALGAFLTRWCERLDKPLVLMLDEADALVGQTLVALLRQLRSLYGSRPRHAPSTVVLCGVRDLRDYRFRGADGQDLVTGGSAFNVKAKSLRLGDFSRAEVETLLREHTKETGQVFTAEAVERVWGLTLGQPWLVNALANEATFELKEGRDRAVPVGVELIDRAKEALIVRRETHLDQLADKLREPRVRRIMEPMLAGTAMGQVADDDIQYLVDLGLCRLERGRGLEVANPIYREVLPRVLSFAPESATPALKPTWLDAAGRLDAAKLLESFLGFWRQHGQPLLGTAAYTEIAPHLVLMAFLHRVVNGGGSIEREYAIGSGRMDLCLRYGGLTLAMELKVWRDGERDPLTAGLAQLDGYLAGLGLDTGWLVLFDRRSGLPPIEERTSSAEAVTPGGRRVVVVRG